MSFYSNIVGRLDVAVGTKDAAKIALAARGADPAGGVECRMN